MYATKGYDYGCLVASNFSLILDMYRNELCVEIAVTEYDLLSMSCLQYFFPQILLEIMTFCLFMKTMVYTATKFSHFIFLVLSFYLIIIHIEGSFLEKVGHVDVEMPKLLREEQSGFKREFVRRYDDNLMRVVPSESTLIILKEF